jgi:molybdenum cofactor cytidylyltransferase
MQLVDGFRLAMQVGAPDVVAFVGGGGKSSTAFRLAHETVGHGRRAIVTSSTQMGENEARSAPVMVEAGDGSLPWDRLMAALDAHGWCTLVGPPRREKRAGIAPQQIDLLAAQAATLRLSLVTVEADGSRKLPVKAPADHEPVIPACATLVVPVVGIDAVGRTLSEDAVHRPERIRAALGLPPSAVGRLTPRRIVRLLLHPQGGDKGRLPTARRTVLINKVERPEELAAARLMARMLAASGAASLIGAVGRVDRPPVVERWAPAAVVVLAAGQAQRMGAAKQLLTVDGMPLVERALRTALASAAQQVVLVIGAHGDQVAAAAAPFVAAHPHVTMVHNPLWAAGQATSMHAGLAALSAAVEGAVFMPVDQPFLPPALLRRMIRAWRQGAPLVAPQADGALRGAPALFDRSLWSELRAITGDVGGRAVLQRHAAQVETVAVAADLLRDLDTPDDLG